MVLHDEDVCEGPGLHTFEARDLYLPPTDPGGLAPRLFRQQVYVVSEEE